jgi:toxin-antitoxin system PIN domain toxin
MRALLDINVLIAVHDRDHVHHTLASEWLETHSQDGWASCPLTQNGFLRIMGQSAYSNPQPLALLVQMLQSSTGPAFHQFWPDDISILDGLKFNHPHIHSPRQLTDLYLLGLAVKNHGCLVTFDQRIPLSAVNGARPGHLAVL